MLYVIWGRKEGAEKERRYTYKNMSHVNGICRLETLWGFVSALLAFTFVVLRGHGVELVGWIGDFRYEVSCGFSLRLGQ